MKRSLLVLIAVLVSCHVARGVSAQESPSVRYVPLIGITSVPESPVLPKGPGKATYRYAVKNFLREVALGDIQVVDDKCGPVLFVTGDDDLDSMLDHSETWRYVCTTDVSETTHSVATATGRVNGATATHKAFTTIVVGTETPAPLVSIVNVTKVAQPLSLPAEGGEMTFAYRVNNPGVVPLNDVRVIDNRCSGISSGLGDTNANGLLDTHEVWFYTCTTILTQTTTSTVRVTASANGQEAVSEATLTVDVALLPPSFPDAGTTLKSKEAVWAILSTILAALLMYYFLTRKGKAPSTKKSWSSRKLIALVLMLAGAVGAVSYFLVVPLLHRLKTVVVPIGMDGDTIAVNTASDDRYGWKFPIARFPMTGGGSIAYSDIRDPGGIPEGLPVRLKIPVIGVDSAIEDALITPDGRMDVPAGSVNVAWFALGPRPGKEGSAVIGGHFGIRNGVPFVFYDLDKLKVGDEIYVIDDRGLTHTFVVRKIALFDRDADATTVFSSDDGLAHLNLITCEGIWNRLDGTYPDRRVVFTDAVPSGGAAQALDSFPRPLRLGSRGADVEELQTALVEMGFLTIPRGIEKGYFGALTHTAVSRYQASVGLSETGVFNPETGAKLIAMMELDSRLPNVGNDAVPRPQGTSVRGLFVTMKDALITSALLLAIMLVSYLIVRLRRPRP